MTCGPRSRETTILCSPLQQCYQLGYSLGFISSCTDSIEPMVASLQAVSRGVGSGGEFSVGWVA